MNLVRLSSSSYEAREDDELPAESDVPLARWSYTELAAEAVSRGVVASISPSTVGRWLRADAIRHVGAFDPRYFLYAEETDWQRRALD